MHRKIIRLIEHIIRDLFILAMLIALLYITNYWKKEVYLMGIKGNVDIGRYLILIFFIFMIAFFLYKFRQRLWIVLKILIKGK